MVAGCVLNKPPDTAALKELALPGLQTPAQWTAAGAGAGQVCRQLARDIPRRSVDSGRCRSHRPQRRPARRRRACRAGACSTPSLQARSCGRRSISSRVAAANYPGDGSGLQGGVLSATWELDLWGRVRYGRAASAAQAASAQADFEYARQSIAALVAKSWFLATEAGLQLEAARETIRASEELVRLADDRTRIGVAQSRRCVRGARQRRHLSRRRCASSSWHASRRFERSRSCSAGTPRPQRSSRRNCRVSR